MRRRHFIGMLAGMPLLPVALLAGADRFLPPGWDEEEFARIISRNRTVTLIGNPMDSGWRPNQGPPVMP